MDKEKKIEQLLKFIYYILGLNVASFAFVVSKLSSLEYNIYNFFLVVSLVSLGVNICILFFFVVIVISRDEDYWIDKIKRKKTRKIVGFLGSSTGITIALVIFWILLFKGYITI